MAGRKSQGQHSPIMSIGQIERVTMGERIYNELCQLLIAGKLQPGERLSLRTVAEALGVSMMPVREAVARLVADGALTVHANRAITVPLMTVAKLRELTRIRIEIEGYAVAEAATRCTAGQLAAIGRLDAAFRQATLAPEGGSDDSLRLNKELHFAIYEAAGSPVLLSIIEGLWLKVGPIFNLDLRAARRFSTGAAEKHHAALVAALTRRDPEGARQALSADILSSLEFVVTTGSLPD
ncbi:GntR family transcriptional regulator [Cereibacter sphaeroides]|uniref:GntR family transcriptional regulator n=2 Tax=Cereibacter azotoformans TaxID=43057 RepID=A0A2T5KD59_9RHOB|nr:GntR family transcriptional regulator [Cereibacter sphaeroides]MBO4168649.1 GntR family transcriptional regulator [Cereibacter azotoformans]PTR20361.1 GntR family transcriptional regulator [Cereibacter azotoformans]